MQLNMGDVVEYKEGNTVEYGGIQFSMVCGILTAAIFDCGLNSVLPHAFLACWFINSLSV